MTALGLGKLFATREAELEKFDRGAGDELAWTVGLICESDPAATMEKRSEHHVKYCIPKHVVM